jgi:uncharacterized protein YndB with AHSA1/START domain
MVGSMRVTTGLLAAALLTGPAGLRAEVVDAAAGGFTVKLARHVAAPPEEVYATAVAVGRWWSPDHTFSGSAAALSIDARPGGCWCETLPGGGGVRHLEVVYAAPGSLLRFSGGLGPLQATAASGSLTWTFAAAGDGTDVTWTYAVAGDRPGGLEALAPAVDAVLAEQIDRLKAAVEGK